MKPKLIEVWFNILYLSLVFCLGVFLMVFRSDIVSRLWGIMSFVLVLGDSFHLVPRIMVALGKEEAKYNTLLGRGKQITSISMTIFYGILWQIGLILYDVSLPFASLIVYFLMIIRIILCLMPYNGWVSNEPSYRWGIYRNIPFVIMGMIVVWLFASYADIIPNLKFMAIAIILSFAFYIPVVLFSSKKPMVGMLMLPKTLMYVWIVCMGI